MTKTLLELMASKYAYQTLSFINDHPMLSKQDILRSFPADEEKTRFTRITELEQVGLISAVMPVKRKSKHNTHNMMITERGSQILALCTQLSANNCSNCVPEVHDGFAWLTKYYREEKEAEDLLPLPEDFYTHINHLKEKIDLFLSGDERLMKQDRLKFLVREIREMRLKKMMDLVVYNGLRANTVDIPFNSNLQKEKELYEKMVKIVREYNSL